MTEGELRRIHWRERQEMMKVEERPICRKILSGYTGKNFMTMRRKYWKKLYELYQKYLPEFGLKLAAEWADAEIRSICEGGHYWCYTTGRID